MELKPLFDRVLAIPQKIEKKTSSGISISNSDESEVKKAKVIAVGKGIYDYGVFIDMQVNCGDIIYYEEHTCAKLNDGEKDYILIKQQDILAYEER